ncbi:MAG: DNA polymerase III subunit chi [Burkholderiales bacterium]|nr:DNA polymerase III subunit chi [Burkholderiales bacterium]
MTRIDFYFEAEDKLQVACRLSAKAAKQKLRVLIYAPDETQAQRIDKLLWTWLPAGFLPHCMTRSPLAAQTPVLITHDPEDTPHDEVLLNLHSAWPPAFSRFQRLVEIVGRDEEDREAARGRFRFYRDRGYAIDKHDLSKAQA